MSKHTPGPWAAEDLYIMARNYRVATVHAGASSEMKDDAAGLEESYADARLIAAAPDLLEALKKLEAAYADLDSHFCHSLHPDDLAAVRAVIAKAEGAK